MDMEINGLNTRSEQIESEIRREHELPGQNSSIIMQIFEISREIPKNVHDLSPPQAEYLSGAMLKGMGMCGELYSLAVSYELKVEARKKAEFSRAMMVKATEAGFKSAKDREQFAFSDADFLAAQEKCIEAKMFKTMVEEKKQLFLKAHHLMKDVVSKDTNNSERKSPQKFDTDEWGRRIL